jgi:hypothetical protein
MISGSDAPFARFIKVITSAFLLERPGFCLPADFLARGAFLAPASFWRAFRPALGCGASAAGVPLFSESIALLLRFS